nr:unnamed protein product [Digitaria exilis]
MRMTAEARRMRKRKIMKTHCVDEFWICCDACETWFHGKCVKITPAKAEHIKHYKCPNCTGGSKRARA